MRVEEILRSGALVLVAVAVTACAGSSSSSEGKGGSAGIGGALTAGAPGAGGSTAGTGAAGSADPNSGGNGASGSASGGKVGSAGSGGAMPNGGGGAGGSTVASGGTATAAGGTGVAGSAGGGAAGSSGSAGTASSKEDDGADCVVGALPDSSSLPAIAKLPDPFKKLDGTRIASKAEWRCRREELRKQAEKYAYGTKPAKPQSVTGTVSNSSISVQVMDNGKSASFTASVKLPTSGSAPYPAIVIYGGGGFGAPLDSGVINSEGIAQITYDPYSVGKEGTGRTNKQGAFYSIAGSSSTTGLLVAWGWGVSRIIDVIEQSDGKIFKAGAIAVTGCSRFGKGAFVAGVFDQRIALTMPIESGTAGVPFWRGISEEGAQSLSSAYGEQPWFGDAFSAFTGNPTKAPIDTHEAIAMIAPRGLLILDNPSIANLGPKAAHVATMAGAEVYKALGAGENISYVSDEQEGGHCSMRPEWSAPLRSNVRKFLTKTGNDPGVIKVSPKATGKPSDWIDWTTPSLN
jgi:hypothetical protein